MTTSNESVRKFRESKRNGTWVPIRVLWTEQEEEQLRAMAGKMTTTRMSEQLPGRTRAAVRKHLIKLGISAMPEHRRGPDHPRWKGGIATAQYYGSHWFTTIRWKVYQRDNFTCLECGHHDETGASLKAHHIIPFAVLLDHSLANHVTLCKPCHDQQPAHRGQVMIDDLPEYQRRILGGCYVHG